MKTLNQFMGEAIELLPAEEINEDVLITEEDIIDSIVEALEGEQVTEEEFVEIYNMVIEQLSGEETSEEILDEQGVPGTTSIRVSGTGSGRQYSVNGQAVSQQQGQNAIAAGMNRAAASNPALATMRAQSSSSTTTSSAPRPSTSTVAPRPVPTGTRSYSGGNMIKNFEEELAEAHDIELKPHSNGTHYTVHKINPNSGIKSDQLKSGETINDSHVDDLHDMGYKVKIHKGNKLNENIEDDHSEAYDDHENLISKVKDSSAKKKFASEFEKHADNFSHHYDNEDDDQAEHALSNMQEVNDRIRAHLKKK